MRCCPLGSREHVACTCTAQWAKGPPQATGSLMAARGGDSANMTTNAAAYEGKDCITTSRHRRASKQNTAAEKLIPTSRQPALAARPTPEDCEESTKGRRG